MYLRTVITVSSFTLKIEIPEGEEKEVEDDGGTFLV